MNLVYWIATIALLPAVFGIFEDQVGKFDWRKQLVGCPVDVVFDKHSKNTHKLILSTEEDIITSLSSNTGDIVWRRILEKPEHHDDTRIAFKADNEYIYSLTDGGRSVRVWRKIDGVLTWQAPFDEEKSSIGSIEVTENLIVASNSRKVVTYSIKESTEISSVHLQKDIVLSKIIAISPYLLVHVSAKKNAKQFEIRLIENGIIGSVSVVSNAKLNVEKCNVFGKYLVCFHSDTMLVLDAETNSLVEKNTGVVIREVVGTTNSIAVRSPSSVKIYSISGSNINDVKEIALKDLHSVSVVENSNSLLIIGGGKIKVVSLKDGSQILEANLPSKITSTPSRVFATSAGSSNKEFEVVIVGSDCSVNMIVLTDDKAGAVVEWIREESLTKISSVEMFDLPLSESQQLIEDEFEGDNNNIVSAFLRRVIVQVGQLRRYAVRSVENIFSLKEALAKHTNGFSDFLMNHRSTDASSQDDTFERDYFNLRKVILVTTLNGVVYGVDSAGGKILWKSWLGANFSPLKTEDGLEHVPLFVQRTTAHYQLNGLAAVAFSDLITSKGVVVQLNPMDGTVVHTENLGSSIDRVSLLPFVDSKHVHPLLVVEKNKKITYVPKIGDDVLATAAPIFIMETDLKTNAATGIRIDLLKQTMKNVWSGNLGLTKNDKIIAVKGKPYNQKVHSQGRVLVDREVQYKYVNPNLAAIASIDASTQYLTIVLVDVVSGQIVHSATVAKAAEPVHLVHSENWIAYTYWSEKGRRTELGVIELYEGSDELSQKNTFDSLVPTKHAPVVMAQSYIYAQGVDAMSVSETEQGLTTRSILIAHPSGNIHEVSRRLLDATRPMELTQAMREEMMIGYMPEIAVATEEMINYNQTVHRVRGIKAAPSGLESTSLIMAYGTDLFFTRLTPSGTFDILKDDFDHVFISLVLAALVIGSYVSKRLARSNALAAQWA